MRILVMRPGALGDVLLTLPALAALQARFAEAAIEVMGNPAVLQLLPGRSVVSAVSSFDRADVATLFQPEVLPDQSLQSDLDSFDLVLSYATAPGHVFARNLARLVRGRVVSFAARPGPDVHVHMSEYLQRPLRELGVPVYTGYPALLLTATDQQEAAQWWDGHGLANAKVVAIHPGSGSIGKNWRAAGFAALAKYLWRERGTRVLLLSGPADDVAVSEVQQWLEAQEYTPARNLPLPLLAAILARCQAYLGNDSGVSHLAAAVGTHTVAIFGPTDPGLWAPRAARVRVVQGRVPCAPCEAEQRQRCGQRFCLEAVSVAQVVEALAPSGQTVARVAGD